jgi:hypothetical protein
MAQGKSKKAGAQRHLGGRNWGFIFIRTLTTA